MSQTLFQLTEVRARMTSERLSTLDIDELEWLESWLIRLDHRLSEIRVFSDEEDSLLSDHLQEITEMLALVGCELRRREYLETSRTLFPVWAPSNNLLPEGSKYNPIILD